MQKLGAVLRQKGKYYFVFLVLNKGIGSKNYEQIYGQYVREKEAINICKKQNRVASCIQCNFKRDCKFAR